MKVNLNIDLLSLKLNNGLITTVVIQKDLYLGLVPFICEYANFEIKPATK